MRRIAAVARTLVVLAVTGSLLAATAGPAHAAGGITCQYRLTQWPAGFMADLVITNNTATAIDGWTAFWTFRTATQVLTTWNGSIIQGTPFDATARNISFNAVIWPGTSTTLGWTATATGTDVPAQITVNGASCPVL